MAIEKFGNKRCKNKWRKNNFIGIAEGYCVRKKDTILSQKTIEGITSETLVTYMLQ